MSYRFDGFEIDTRNYRILHDGEVVDVEPKVFDLLTYLIEHRDRLVTREELFENLWSGQVVSDASLSNQIKAARKAIGDSGSTQIRIKTLHGRGYQFVAEVECAHAVRDSHIDAEDAYSHVVESGPSIAVLPFANRCGDDAKNYICHGITDDIRVGLSRFTGLLVIARGSSHLLGDDSVDVTDVARTLGVRYLLKGSVRIVEKRVRITTQLIGSGGRQVWAETYERMLDDIFDVLDDVTQAIVATLARRLEKIDRAAALKKPNDDLTLYDLLLRARHCFPDWKGTKADVLQARALYERAIEFDSTCTAAYSGLAGTYSAEYLADWCEDRDEAGRRLFELARRAIALDDGDSAAHLVLACGYRDIRGNLDLATEHLNRAISANPNDYTNYCCKCGLMIITGDLDESISCGQEAMRRNPLLPDDCLTGIGYAEYLSGRYERAATSFDAQLTPDATTDAYVAACYAQLGRDTEARTAAIEFQKKNLENPVIEAEHDPQSWQDYWSRTWHFEDPVVVDRLLDGLRKAGIVTS